MLKYIFFGVVALLCWPALTQAAPSVLINEVAWMGTQTSSNDEWIELYNPGEETISLEGWTLLAADGSPDITLAGEIAAGGYYLLERTDDESVPNSTADLIYSGALGNTGEQLELRDAQGNVIDSISSTDGWPAGDNTEKFTMERTSEAGWANSVAAGGTPKAINSATASDAPDTAEDTDEADGDPNEDSSSGDQYKKPKVKRGDILFNEIFPRRNHADIEEFIELRNATQYPINLEGFELQTKLKKIFRFPPTYFAPHQLLHIPRSVSQLPLHDQSEQLTLRSAEGSIIDRVELKNSPADQSYNRRDDEWLWLAELTPGKENIVPPKLTPPVAVLYGPKETEVYQIITFDASDSFDYENRELKFSWDFGDGRTAAESVTRQLFTQAGTYNVTVNVQTPDTASSTATLQIKVADATPPPASTSTPTSTTALLGETYVETTPYIIISEVLPNPEGPDGENEFIELFNFENAPVNLTGWKIDDAEGGSAPYVFSEQIILPGQFLVLPRPMTKLALNNDTDSVRLFTPNDTLVDSMTYEESSQGQSWIRDEQFNWLETATPSPGELNVANQTEDDLPTQTPVEPKATATPTAIEITQESNSTKRKTLAIGSLVTVLGLGVALKNRKAA